MIDFKRILEVGYLEGFPTFKIVKQVLRVILEHGVKTGAITKTEIEVFKVEKGPSSTFRLTQPLLSSNIIDITGHQSYYVDAIEYYGEDLYLNSQWGRDSKRKEKLIQWIRNWVYKNSEEGVAIPRVFKGEEQDPFTPPESGNDSTEEYSQLVRYNTNVYENEKVENLCSRIESEYRELVYHFARDIFDEHFRQDFPPLIKVVLCKECPSKIYLNSDAYVTKKVNELIKRGKMLSPTDVSKILRFNMRIAGEFISGDVPYIKIYFNQFEAKSMEEYVSMVMNVLAHEFAHYLEFEYCKRYKVPHYQDERVSEAIADFFGLLFSCYRSEIVIGAFDLDVVEKRYNGWLSREGSGWPYAYALHFLRTPYKSKFSEYSAAEIDVAREKLRTVFQATPDVHVAFGKLTM